MGKHSGLLFKVIFLAVLLGCVVLPLLKMFLFIDGEALVAITSTRQFQKGLLNSLHVTTVATLISLAISFALAWSMVRTQIRRKSVWTLLLTLPMLIPSISHSSGLIILFGANGILTKALGLNMNLYGFWGIVAGSVMYSFPFAFLMIQDILKYESFTQYEVAAVLGVSRFHQLKDITAVYLRKPMISVVFSVFTMIFTDYGVPIVIGGKFQTLPVIMYHEVIGQLDFGKGSVIGFILLFPALLSFAIDSLNRDRAGGSAMAQPFVLKPSKARDAAASLFCGLVVLMVALNNAAFLVLAFAKQYPIDLTLTLQNVRKTFDMNGAEYLVNSLVISGLVALLGTGIGFVTAYLTSRMRSLSSAFLHLFSMLSLAIPGIVLGLSYALLYKGSALQGTLTLLVMANITHFFGSPYLMMYNALGKVNENLEAVGSTLGVSRLRIVLDVILPHVKGTLLEMGSYLFVNSMITISAVSFLATTANKPFSLMINQFDALMLLECSAVVSLILLLTNGLWKALVYGIKRYGIQKTLQKGIVYHDIQKTV